MKKTLNGLHNVTVAMVAAGAVLCLLNATRGMGAMFGTPTDPFITSLLNKALAKPNLYIVWFAAGVWLIWILKHLMERNRARVLLSVAAFFFIGLIASQYMTDDGFRNVPALALITVCSEFGLMFALLSGAVVRVAENDEPAPALSGETS